MLQPLGPEHIVEILRTALTDVGGLGDLSLRADDDALGGIARFANGDARVALNVLELAAAARETSLSMRRSSRRSRRTGRCYATRPARALQPHLRAAQIDAQQRP